MLKKLNILIIDDDESIMDVFKGHLEDTYNVFTHTQWPEAAITLQRASIDLILVDLQMPNVNGDERIMAIKDSRKKLPKIVLMSAHDPSFIAQKAKECGADGFLQKAPPFAHMLNELRMFL